MIFINEQYEKEKRWKILGVVLIVKKFAYGLKFAVGAKLMSLGLQQK